MQLASCTEARIETLKAALVLLALCMISLFSWLGFWHWVSGHKAKQMAHNKALSKVLDEDDSPQTSMLVDDQGQQLQGEVQQPDEQLLRQRAEADALDKAQRLRVLQCQLAEYAAEKQADALKLVAAIEGLQSAVDSAVQSIPTPVQEALMTHVKSLRQSLADHAAEAQAFAAQQKADVESLKRSSEQAGMASSGDTDMKRAREDEGSNGAAASSQEDVATDGNGVAASSDEEDGPSPAQLAQQQQEIDSGTWAERAKYIPMRLEQRERRLLRLLEAALTVSEYTDKVDILTWRNKAQRIHAQIKDICAILSGLVVAQDYKVGQQLIKDRDFAENAEFFQAVFEIGRRYKIMNPEKMRSEYGKLMYMLMDSAHPDVQELLDFKCVKPLNTVARFLEERGGSKLLRDPLLNIATAEILTANRSRPDIQRDIKTKEHARERLAKRYCNSQLSQEQLLTAIYSLSDNNTYLLFNRDPIDRMLAYFKHFFRPDTYEPEYSLAIQSGRGGARLSHNHERQYNYVLQSLTLWREISTNMFKLWYLAEEDMLREGNAYRLCDTGQGLNRVQAAPAVARAIHGILAKCQAQIGSWVGSSVVHLGDHNVPSAFMFIDKYTQVPRILNPVVMVLDELPRLYKDAKIRAYIDSAYGSLEDCLKTICCDFCRHAFDGSGADSFFDAGSCIDGRLTSAWNWCSKLEKKYYWPVFRLAGFHGFDGDFK